MGLVPDREPVKEWMRNFLDRVFTPVETNDWVVEQVLMHPLEFEELRKNVPRDQLDLIAVKELIDAGHRASLFGAQVRVDENYRRRHYEVLYGDLKLKNTVCLRKNETTREDCPDLECLVEIVHAF